MQNNQISTVVMVGGGGLVFDKWINYHSQLNICIANVFLLKNKHFQSYGFVHVQVITYGRLKSLSGFCCTYMCMHYKMYFVLNKDKELFVITYETHPSLTQCRKFLPTNREGGGGSLYFNKHKLILMHPSFIVKSTVVIKPDFTTF